MKKILVVLALLISGYVSFGQSLQQELEQAVTQNNFFRVRALLADTKRKLPPEMSLYYTALSENKFDACDLSNKHIEEVFKKYQRKLPDSLLLGLLNAKASNALRLYQYKVAVEASRQILKGYGRLLDSADVKNHENMLGLFGALADLPPQEMERAKNDTIPAYRNKFNHLMVPPELYVPLP